MLRARGIHPANLPRLCSAPGWPAPQQPLHLFVCIADHFEPKWKRPTRQVERQRVAEWVHGYPRSVAGLCDSHGRPPQHTFFYPIDEYDPEHLDRLARLHQAGLADVEVHLHHDHDTAPALREKLEGFKHTLFHRHALLGTNDQGDISYGFIHGNWALDNSRPDGRWCGVNDELTVLVQSGCYADFTLPSAPSPTQTSTVNSIYYATDDPARPKSHDRGVAARLGRRPPPDSLLMVQGPLALDWSRRKWGMLPRLENAELHATNPPTLGRLRLWIRAGVSIQGRPDWIFIKLHTHGAQEANAAMLLGPPMRAFHEQLAAQAHRNPGWQFSYVTARELASLVHQAEADVREPAIGSKEAGPPPVDLPGDRSDFQQVLSGSRLRRAIDYGDTVRPATTGGKSLES
ncbi:MAG: hypothetical protein WD403_12450 [Pirellulales bacterium]